MSLQLFELVPTTPSREAAEALIAQVSQAVEAAGASVLESQVTACLLYTSPSPRDVEESRMPSSA